MFMLTSDCFQTYVIHYGDTDSLNDLRLEGIAVPMLTSIGSYTHSCFYKSAAHLMPV